MNFSQKMIRAVLDELKISHNYLKYSTEQDIRFLGDHVEIPVVLLFDRSVFIAAIQKVAAGAH